MANNEIKLDSKATNYLKDKLGGGGGGATYTAGNGIFISEDNDISILEFIENIEDISTNLSKSRVKHILDVDMGAFIPGAIKVDITDSESEDYYVYLYPNRKGYDDNDNDVFIWTSPVKNNKYYQMTLALENPLPNQTPITVEEISVGGAGGASYIANVWCYYMDYEAVLTLTVDDNTLETYADLLNYLKNKKCSGRQGGDFVMYPCSGVGTDGSIFGIHAEILGPDEEGYEYIMAHSNTISNVSQIANDDNFSISYAK